MPLVAAVETVNLVLRTLVQCHNGTIVLDRCLVRLGAALWVFYCYSRARRDYFEHLVR